jgi:hypothetical protein
MAPVGFEPPNPSKRAAADPRLSPRGHWDRQGVYWRIILKRMDCEDVRGCQINLFGSV